MKCPRCGQHTTDAWKPLQTNIPRPAEEFRGGGEMSLASMFIDTLPLGDSGREFIKFDWMRCEDEACLQTVVRVHETTVNWVSNIPLQHSETRNLYPSASSRDPAPLGVPDSMRKDYDEAGAILELSPRMASVLARKIVSDLLKKYAKRDEKRLTAQIDSYLAQPGIPSWITSGLHHVREAADMSAHTQEDQSEDQEDAGTVIEIDREEAEWTLDFVLRLFDHFILGPAKDAEIQARIEDKSRRAGRRPFGRDKGAS